MLSLSLRFALTKLYALKLYFAKKNDKLYENTQMCRTKNIIDFIKNLTVKKCERSGLRKSKICMTNFTYFYRFLLCDITFK